MEKRAITITSKLDTRIKIDVIPGHFATTHSHINYYIDMTGIKSQVRMAREAGIQMATKYTSVPIDTIICMDGCEVIGSFLARELTKRGTVSMNSGGNMNLVTPEFNANGQIIFRDNTQSMIWNKNVLLLMASATTGKTINRCLECIKYYGGNVIGISTIFSAVEEQQGIKVDTLFSTDDVSNYNSYGFTECPYCQKRQKIDAIVNSYGYSKI